MGHVSVDKGHLVGIAHFQVVPSVTPWWTDLSATALHQDMVAMFLVQI